MSNLSISMFFLLASSIGFVLSNPLTDPLLDGYKDLPQCLQPPVSGLCLAYFPRYHYDANTDSCKSFVYGGCKGNENNFFSEEECLAKCKGFKPATTDFKLITESDVVEEQSADQEQPPVDPCTLPSDTGDCRAAFPRLFYNAATSKCEQFIYGGCNGNANNFKTIEECKQKCESGSSEEANSASQDSPKVDEPEAESVAKNE